MALRHFSLRQLVATAIFSVFMLVLPAAASALRPASEYGSETLFSTEQNSTTSGGAFEYTFKLNTPKRIDPSDGKTKIMSDLVKSLRAILPAGTTLDPSANGLQGCPRSVLDKYIQFAKGDGNVTLNPDGSVDPSTVDGWRDLRPKYSQDIYPCDDSYYPVERRNSLVGTIDMKVVADISGTGRGIEVPSHGRVILGQPDSGEVAKLYFYIKGDLTDTKPSLIVASIKGSQASGYTIETQGFDRQQPNLLQGGPDPYEDNPLPGSAVIGDSAVIILDVTEMTLKIGGSETSRYDATGLLGLPVAAGSHPTSAQLQNRDYGPGSDPFSTCPASWDGWEYLNVIGSQNQLKCQETDGDYQDELLVSGSTNERPYVWGTGAYPASFNAASGEALTLLGLAGDPEDSASSLAVNLWLGGQDSGVDLPYNASLTGFGPNAGLYLLPVGPLAGPVAAGIPLKAVDSGGKESTNPVAIQILNSRSSNVTGSFVGFPCSVDESKNADSPQILLSGWQSDLDVGGGNLQAKVLTVPGASGSPVTEVEAVMPDGSGTGLYLNDRAGGIFDFNIDLTGPLPETQIPLGFVARDASGRSSNIGPCINAYWKASAARASSSQSIQSKIGRLNTLKPSNRLTTSSEQAHKLVRLIRGERAIALPNHKVANRVDRLVERAAVKVAKKVGKKRTQKTKRNRKKGKKKRKLHH